METQVSRERPDGMPGSQLAKGLGWFSVGLGLAELAAPRMLARMIGIEGDDRRTASTLRAVGARELMSGVGVLARPRMAAPMWSRVIGDVIDLGLLGYALGARRVDRNRFLGAMVAVLGVTVLDVVASQRLASVGRPQRRATKFITVTVNRALPEVAARWKDVAGDLDKRGHVVFRSAPGGRGTEICLEIKTPSRLRMAMGRVLHNDAEQLADGDLRKVKQLLELGEIVHSDASIQRGLHPAQPTKGA